MKLQTQNINYPIAESLIKLGFSKDSAMVYYGFDLINRSLGIEKYEIFERFKKSLYDEHTKPILKYMNSPVPAYSAEELRAYLPVNITKKNKIYLYTEEIRYPFFYLSYKLNSKEISNDLSICEESYPDGLGLLLIQLLIELNRGEIRFISG